MTRRRPVNYGADMADDIAPGVTATDMLPDDLEATGQPTEPILNRALIVGLATAVLELITVFGVDLTADQTGAILSVVSLVALLVLAYWSRGTAWAPATVRRLVLNTARDTATHVRAGGGGTRYS